MKVAHVFPVLLAPVLLIGSALLTGSVLLVGCQHRDADSLTARVLFTANGSYDASADSRTRQGKGFRRVQWQRHPPLSAEQVTVDYDSDVRPLSWVMTLTRPQVRAAALTGQDAKAVTTPDGPALLIRSGDLKNVLLLERPGELRLLSRGYAAKQAPELLPAFAP